MPPDLRRSFAGPQIFRRHCSLSAQRLQPEASEWHLVKEPPGLRRGGLQPVPMELLGQLKEQARANPQQLVLFEGEEERVLIAAEMITRERLSEIILLGNPKRIRYRAQALGLRLHGIECLNPAESSWLEIYAERLYQRRKGRGMTEEQAIETAARPPWFAGLMVAEGRADACVGGAATTTAVTTRAMVWTIGKDPETEVVSSFHLMISPHKELGAQGALLFADCGVVPEPTPHQLAEIALATAESARAVLGIEPRVAMLSFSTWSSAAHRLARGVVKATQMVKARAPEILVEGEMQLDAALSPRVAARKAPGSRLAGRANVLIFPNLDAGNIGYKMAERLGNCTAVGPAYQGLARAASDLSRGCEAPDIVNAVALTAFQAIRTKARAVVT